MLSSPWLLVLEYESIWSKCYLHHRCPVTTFRVPLTPGFSSMTLFLGWDQFARGFFQCFLLLWGVPTLRKDLSPCSFPSPRGVPLLLVTLIASPSVKDRCILYYLCRVLFSLPLAWTSFRDSSLPSVGD